MGIAYGNFFCCLAQLSNCKEEEGVINQWAVEDRPQLSPNKGMNMTIDVLTTKKKVKMESHKESEGQMEVARLALPM